MALLSPERQSKLAHASPRIYLTLAIAYPLMGVAVNIPGIETVGIVVAVVIFVVQLTLVAATSNHERALCVTCGAMTPLDGAAEAAKRDHLLRRWHRKWFALPGIAAVVVGVLLVLLFDLPGLVMDLGVSTCLTYTALAQRAAIVHRVLYPWCPYCRRRRRWEDGGDHEPTPDPDPVAEKTA